MTGLAINYDAPRNLVPYPRNARTHSKKHIGQIVESIRRFGWTNPILVDGNGGVIAGHGRLMAALELGLETVPVVEITSMSEAEKRAYILADNRLAENAGWDHEILATELQFLVESDLDLDVTVTGFEMPEIDILIGELQEEEPEEEVELPDREMPAVTRAGDLWEISKHRLLCGDATSAEDLDRLLGKKKAQMVFTDPPYNVPVDGHVCGLGAVKHREFAMASGEMNEDEFTSFLGMTFANLACHSTDGSLHFVCMDWRHMGEILEAGRKVCAELKNLCVWAKTNGGMGSLYRSTHELVFVFKSGTKAHINNVELGRHGRNRTNVWSYAGVNTFSETRNEDLAAHPTVKPVAMVADAILDCSRRGGSVLDVFAGSGTTLLAAEKTGRRGYGLELDPLYCDVIIRRLQKVTGSRAVHVKTGVTFDDLEGIRLATRDAAE